MTLSLICLKLKTGETLFGECEVTNLQVAELNNRNNIRIENPMLVKETKIADKQEGILLMNWVPFVNSCIFDISLSNIYYIGELKKDFKQFYGNSRVKEEINLIHRRAYERIEGGENPKMVTEEALHEMINLVDLYAMKYDLDSAEVKENFSLHEIDASNTDKKLH